MKADLHFHSKYSDGLYWPDELVKMASKIGLEMIALTDHDTFEGVEDFLKSTNENNIIGQQFSVKQIHIENQHLTEMSKK